MWEAVKEKRDTLSNSEMGKLLRCPGLMVRQTLDAISDLHPYPFVTVLELEPNGEWEQRVSYYVTRSTVYPDLVGGAKGV